MSAKKTENGAKNKATVKIELVSDDETPDFPDEKSDRKAIDAEVFDETKYSNQLPEDFITDEFADFLSGLPNDADASFIVSRLPDRNLKGEFRNPCNVQKRVDLIYWNGEKPDEIYSQITERHAGGKYHFQVRQGNGFGKAWTQVLADPPFLSEAERAAQSKNEETNKGEQARTAATSQAFANPAQQPEQPAREENKDVFGDLIKQAEKFKSLVSIFTPPQREASAPPAPEPITKETIQMRIVENLSDDRETLKMAVRSIFDVKPDSVPKERTPGVLENIGNSISTAIATNPALQNKIGDVISIGIETGSAIVSHFLSPKEKPPQQTDAQNPPQQVSLESLRRPRDDAQPAPQPENAAQGEPAGENEVIETTIELETMPLIELE